MLASPFEGALSDEQWEDNLNDVIAHNAERDGEWFVHWMEDSLFSADGDSQIEGTAPKAKWRCTRCGAETDMETLPDSIAPVSSGSWWSGKHPFADCGPQHMCSMTDDTAFNMGRAVRVEE